MAHSPKSAWSNSCRLLAICLGFDTDKKRRLSKQSQTYNQNTGYHEIMLKLEVRQEALLPTSKTYVIESDDSAELLSLVQDINNRLIDEVDLRESLES